MRCDARLPPACCKEGGKGSGKGLPEAGSAQGRAAARTHTLCLHLRLTTAQPTLHPATLQTHRKCAISSVVRLASSCCSRCRSSAAAGCTRLRCHQRRPGSWKPGLAVWLAAYSAWYSSRLRCRCGSADSGTSRRIVRPHSAARASPACCHQAAAWPCTATCGRAAQCAPKCEWCSWRSASLDVGQGECTGQSRRGRAAGPQLHISVHQHQPGRLNTATPQPPATHPHLLRMASEAAFSSGMRALSEMETSSSTMRGLLLPPAGASGGCCDSAAPPAAPAGPAAGWACCAWAAASAACCRCCRCCSSASVGSTPPSATWPTAHARRPRACRSAGVTTVGSSGAMLLLSSRGEACCVCWAAPRGRMGGSSSSWSVSVCPSAPVLAWGCRCGGGRLPSSDKTPAEATDICRCCCCSGARWKAAMPAARPAAAGAAAGPCAGLRPNRGVEEADGWLDELRR